MTMNKMTIAGAVLLTTAVAGAVVAGRASRNVDVGLAPSAATAAEGRGVGEQRRWPLSFDVSVTQPGAAAPVRVRLSGTWTATVVASRAGEVDVAHVIEGARLEGDGVSTPSADEVEALRARLSRRFWVTYRDDGAALWAHFPTDMGATDRNLLQMIAASTQLVRSPGAPSTWTALERDGAGTFMAAYTREGAGITKRKLRYLEVDGAAGPGAGKGLTVEIERAEARFTVEAGGTVRAFEGVEHVRVGMPLGGASTLEIRAATRLGEARVAPAAELSGSLERARASVETVPIRSHAPDPALAQLEQDRRLLAGQTSDGLLAAAGAGGKEPGLPARLAALFRRDPEAVARGLALVRARGGLRIVTASLAASEAGAALAALGGLARDATAPEAVRVEAITALLVVQRPTAAILGDMRALFGDEGAVGDAARLAGAAFARAARDEHAAEAAAIDEALLARWRRASSGGPEERAVLLGALGNSAGATLLPAIQAALAAPEADVRAAAARALRLAEGNSVDAALAAAATRDGDARVRKSAIFAIRFRPFRPFVDAVTMAATKDEAAFVRADAVRLLSEHADDEPAHTAAIVATLTHVAAHDPSAAVRRVAFREEAP